MLKTGYVQQKLQVINQTSIVKYSPCSCSHCRKKQNLSFVCRRVGDCQTHTK